MPAHEAVAEGKKAEQHYAAIEHIARRCVIRDSLASGMISRWDGKAGQSGKLIAACRSKGKRKHS